MNDQSLSKVIPYAYGQHFFHWNDSYSFLLTGLNPFPSSYSLFSPLFRTEPYACFHDGLYQPVSSVHAVKGVRHACCHDPSSVCPVLPAEQTGDDAHPTVCQGGLVVCRDETGEGQQDDDDPFGKAGQPH